VWVHSSCNLPHLDDTRRAHGDLPHPEELGKYSKDELRQLKDEAQQSVQERIKQTDELGRDKPHGQRQGAEQDLVKSIEKHLEDQ